MADFLTYDQVSQAIGLNNPVGEMVRDAAVWYLDTYRDYAGWVWGGKYPLDPVMQAIGDWLEREDPQLVPPIQMPPGGQCPCSYYFCTYKWVGIGGVEFTNTDRQPGPIGAISYGTNSLGLRETFFKVGAEGCGGRRNFNVFSNYTAEDFQNGIGFAEFISIVPDDSQPNNCGNHAPYPPVFIPSAPALSFPTTFSFSPTATIPITFNFVRPTLEINPSANFDVDIRPSINIPEIGINLNFNLGGVTIGFNPQITIDAPVILPDPRPSPPQPRLPDRPATRFDVTCDQGEVLEVLDEIQDQLEEIEECACDRPFTVSTNVLTITGSNNVVLPDNTFLVEVDLQPPFSRFRMQSGGAGPAVYFAGWAWFSYRAGGFGERQPIDSDKKNFLPVPGEVPQRFGWTVTYGGTAVVTVYYKVYS